MNKKNMALSLKLFVSFFFLLVLVLTYGQIMLTLNKHSNELISENVINNYVLVEGLDVTYNQEIDDLVYTKEAHLINRGSYACALPSIWINEDKLPIPQNFYFASLKYDNNESFSDATKNEFQRKISNKIMLFGHEIDGDDQVIISEEMASYLAASLSMDNIEELIEMNFSINAHTVLLDSNKSYNSISLFENLQIVGIFSNHMVGLVNYREIANDSLYNFMITSSNVEYFMPAVFMEIDLLQYNGAETIAFYEQIYMGYDVSYMGEDVYANLEMVSNIQMFINRVLLIIGYMISVALIINFFVVIDNDFRKKKRLYGILSVLGASKQKIVEKMLVDIWIVYLVAAVLSVITSILIIRRIIYMSVFPEMGISAVTLSIFVVTTLSVCFVIISVFIILLLKNKLNKDTIELIK